jgi:hypothetical protein
MRIPSVAGFGLASIAPVRVEKDPESGRAVTKAGVP